MTNPNYKTSFIVSIAIIVLLPLFFIPGRAIPIEIAKAFLLTLGVIIAFLGFLFASLKAGRFSIAKHPITIAILALPLIYYLSSLRANPSSLSLFGYSIETGTFGFMLLSASIFIVIIASFSDSTRVAWGLKAIIFSLSVAAVFAVIKIFFGAGAFEWGVFLGKMGNPVGNWTDLAVAMALLAIFVAFALEMVEMKKPTKFVLYVVFIFSIFVLAVVGFSTIYPFLLVISIAMLAYFWAVERKFESNPPLPIDAMTPSFSVDSDRSDRLHNISWPALVLCILSLIFVINPSFSSSRLSLSESIANRFGIQNVDVRPSFATTLSVSRAVLTEDTFLGSGPNTFGRDWLRHRPLAVNDTPFWSAIFRHGIGFIPTQISSTGAFGILIWLVFLIFLLQLGVKVIRRMPDGKLERFAVISTLLSIIFLWGMSFVYPPSFVILFVVFIISALFVASCRASGVISNLDFSISSSVGRKLVSVGVVALVVIGSISVAFTVFDKVVGAYYFERAVNLSNNSEVSLDEIESLVNRAIDYSREDVYYGALARVNFAKARAATTDTSRSIEENQRIFGESIQASILAADAATKVNPSGHQNWVLLGSIYGELVPSAIAVPGAYEKAKSSFLMAVKHNPYSPEIPLLLARVELDYGNNAEARASIADSLSLKRDYVPALLFIANLDIKENNIAKAIESAEMASLFSPANAELSFEVGLLKYANEDFSGARDSFLRAIAIASNYANARFYLGLSLARLGEIDLAVRELEAVLSTNPDSEEVSEIVARLKAGENIFATQGR
jgi:tetratricopeptide (TPR) repeat protein